MTTSRLICRFAVLALLFAATSAHAQLFRAYLSPTGNDANPCTLQQPCRLLPAALNVVANGGEIWLTGSANYNSATVNINKSVSIIAVPGAVGSVVALGGGPAIEVSTPSLFIALRNIVVTQLAGGGGTVGVQVSANSQVQIDRCLVANLPASGVLASNGGSVRVIDSIVRSNGAWGVAAFDGAHVTVSSSKLVGNTLGGIVTQDTVMTGSAGTRAMVTDSVISGGNFGAQAVSAGDGVSRITLTRSTVERTSTALSVSGMGSAPAHVVISRSMVVNNLAGWVIEGANGFVRTNGNNHITNNDFYGGVLTAFAPL